MHSDRHIVSFLMFSLVTLGLLAGCASTTPAASGTADLGGAREGLMTFFSLLHEGRYSEAVAHYGGTYDVLRDWNPTLDPEDYAALLENGCTGNGLMCLSVGAIVEEKQLSSTEFGFLVEFVYDDGSIFVLGPCCGATESEMPPQTQFSYTVRKVGDEFLVQELPVYVP